MPLRQSAVLSTLVISTRVLLDESPLATAHRNRWQRLGYPHPGHQVPNARPDQRTSHRGMHTILTIYCTDLTYTSGPPGLVLIVGRWAA